MQGKGREGKYSALLLVVVPLLERAPSLADSSIPLGPRAANVGKDSKDLLPFPRISTPTQALKRIHYIFAGHVPRPCKKENHLSYPSFQFSVTSTPPNPESPHSFSCPHWGSKYFLLQGPSRRTVAKREKQNPKPTNQQPPPKHRNQRSPKLIEIIFHCHLYHYYNSS